MSTEPEQPKVKMTHQGGGESPIYGLGLIGAWIFYFKRATTPKERVLAFFKGFAWPVFVVRDLLTFLSKQS